MQALSVSLGGVRGHAAPLAHGPGEVVVAPARLVWNVGIPLLALALAPRYVTPAAVLMSGAFTAFTLCFGHSVGMHRGVIHGAFRMGRRTERALIYLLVLTGLGGPLTMFRMHETRDAHQNRPQAPAYYSYAHGMLTDFWWYLCCTHRGESGATVPERYRRDAYWQWMEATWRWQQLPVAAALFALGGTPWVVWAVLVRLSVGILGHWFVNYAAHTHGYRLFRMHGSGEEGRNHLLWGVLAMGEGWHNNHHAFPRSARFGVRWWELDPGWFAVCALRALGLVWDVKTWRDGAPLREGASATGALTLRDALEDHRASE